MSEVRQLQNINISDLAWFLRHYGLDVSAITRLKADVSSGKAIISVLLFDSKGSVMLDPKGNLMSRDIAVDFDNKSTRKFEDDVTCSTDSYLYFENTEA